MYCEREAAIIDKSRRVSYYYIIVILLLYVYGRPVDSRSPNKRVYRLTGFGARPFYYFLCRAPLLIEDVGRPLAYCRYDRRTRAPRTSPSSDPSLKPRRDVRASATPLEFYSRIHRHKTTTETIQFIVICYSYSI